MKNTRTAPSTMCEPKTTRPRAARVRTTMAAYCGTVTVLAAMPSHASLFKGDTLDAVADGIAWVALVIGPIVAIAVFWLVHILPEKIAEKRKHPQAKAIQTLCLLSLFFGGLLWPIAWLWAYTKPVLHKMAYGTDMEAHEGGAYGNGEPAAEDHADLHRSHVMQVVDREHASESTTNRERV